MATSYPGNINNIYGKKIGVFVIALFISGNVLGQALNKQFYDYDRFIHFGFTIGTNYSVLKYDFSSQWYHQNPSDTVLRISSQGSPGITLGAVADLHLGSKKSFWRDHLDLRFIPSLVLSERQLVYTMKDSTVIKKTIESALVEFPLMIKFKSDRFQNLRFYVIGGGKYSYDLSSTAKASKNPQDPKVSIYPNNYSYEFGAGLDLYFPYFKFSPEIKLSQGINNILVPDNTIYSGVFTRFRSNFIYFSLYFEG
jgi:hypothetical protein